MTEEKELNEKLNKWAGTMDVDYLHLDFGIAYCFKWLVPKVPALYEVIFRKIEGGFQCLIHRKPSYGEDLLIGEGNIESLALCLAIEKLINEH